jgi:hypothetical protein
MSVIKLLSAPIRTIVRFPLFQLIIVIVIILWLQAADDASVFGRIFNGLDKLVDSTLQLVSRIFTVKSFTKSWLTSGFMIAYVYLACLLILFLWGVIFRAAIDVMGKRNFLWSRNVIARERGIQAYRAWLPLENIRPSDIPQKTWEEQFAWPANNEPPYPPLTQRLLRGAATYIALLLIVAALLEVFAPSVLAWLGQLAKMGFG